MAYLVQYYDVSGYYSWVIKCGVNVTLDYYVSRVDDYKICVHLYISNYKKCQVAAFFEALGENPLNLSTNPIKESWGRYKYMNILFLNDDDAYSA